MSGPPRTTARVAPKAYPGGRTHTAAPRIAPWRAARPSPRSSSSVHRGGLRARDSRAASPRPLSGHCENPAGWIAAGRLPRSSSRAAHASGRRCPGPSVKYRTVGSGSPCEWAWPRRPRTVQKEVEGYAGHSRNYFQEEVTCVPSWGTFQIPTPLG